MNKINILDSSIFNRIAAGEVVEKPYSVVKELLDNSIDAKATKIMIEIVDGGIKEIKVSDNGTGIEPDDFDRVFLPHATSKIKTVEDLNEIGTLGFRGEALASISAVAKVELKSKVTSKDYGKQMTIEGGIVKNSQEIGLDNGTTISVKDIFFNVPARAKFLKKPKQEATEITNLISRYILANPNVSFKYILDGKEIYFSTGNGLEDAIFVIYGKDTLSNLLKVEHISTNGIKVSGYVSNPTYSKPNRSYQTLIINGRYVVNSMISLCVYNSFEHYLMKGQFPFYILNLDIPLDKLDVNVHPNKLDVRFENNNEIYGVVYSAVSNALLNANTINSITKPIYDYNQVSGGISFTNKINNHNSNIAQVINLTNDTEENKALNRENEEENMPNVGTMQSAMQTNVKTVENAEKSNDCNYYAKNSVENFYSSLGNVENSAFKQNNAILSNVYDNVRIKIDKLNEIENMQQSTMFNNSLKFIGSLFSTYLLVENDSRVYIIDQHAAHERLLFDELVKQVNKDEVSKQMLLLPYILSVNSLEHNFLEQNLENLHKLGFDIIEFGNLSFRVSAIPVVLKNANIKQVFDGILSELSVFKNIKQADLVLNKLMQCACKHAVKAGDVLTTENVLSLLQQMKNEQMLLQCPHGRPVVIELTKTEIEKWFKRIV